MKVKGKRCPCGKSGSCPQHSGVKMVAYDRNDRRTVWYSFFKEDRKYTREQIAKSMTTRLEKRGDAHLSVILFYDNQQKEETPFEVIRPNEQNVELKSN